MVNLDSNITNLIQSSLTVKASGSIAEQAQSDLQLPDGEDISILLDNEEKNSRR